MSVASFCERSSGSEPPRLLITTVYGKERRVIEEIENVVLRELSVLPRCEVVYGGLILVYGGFDPRQALQTLSKYRLSFVGSVVPVDVAVRASYECISRAVRELIFLQPVRRPIKILGVCRKRGRSIDSCSRLLKYIGEHLESLGIVEVDFDSYEYVIRIEVVDELALVTLHKRDERLC